MLVIPSRKRRGTSVLVAIYPNLCKQRQFERSLAFVRDDSGISAPSLGNRLGGLRCRLTALGQIGIEETEHMGMIDDTNAFPFL